MTMSGSRRDRRHALSASSRRARAPPPTRQSSTKARARPDRVTAAPKSAEESRLPVRRRTIGVSANNMNIHSFSTDTTSAPSTRAEPVGERGRRRHLTAALAAMLLLAPPLSVGPARGQTPVASPTASPAREYRAALADGDATRAAAAVSRMWRGRLSDERLRDLNRRLRVEADDRTVAAVALEFSRLQNAAQARPGEPLTTATAAEPPGDRLVRWLSQAVRP